MIRPNFSSRTQLAVTCVLLALLTGRGSSEGTSDTWTSDTCDFQRSHCIHLEDTATQDVSEERCAYWNRTLICYNELNLNCHADIVEANFGVMRATDALCANCTPKPSICKEVTPSTSPSTSPSTPTSFPPYANCSNTDTPLTPLGTPSLSTAPSSPQCTMPDYSTHYRQHCSAFTLSHIRPFGDRDLNLHTCFLPGSWYLLNHRHLTVAVKGTVADGYTFISQVTVTFLPHPCSPETISYVANASSLPTALPDGTYAPYLHLSVEGDTMATILAPWINTTVIIRRAFGHLAVTLQVPEPLTRSQEVGGLCSAGCPKFTRVPTTDLSSRCPLFTVQALMKCLDLSNDLRLPTVDPGYSQLCGYDVVKTENISLLSLFGAYGGDALLLPDVMGGTNPPSISQETPATTQLTETSSTPRDSIVIAPHTMSPIVARAHTTSHLNLLLLSLCLLAVWSLTSHT